jgi:hypothetical protein
MATVIAQPHTGPLHLPAVLHNLKPLFRVLNHFESSLVRLFEVVPPVVQPLCVIAGIDPYLAPALAPRGIRALQQGDTSLPIICRSGSDHDRRQEPEGVDHNRSCASFDILVPVTADALDLRHRLATRALGTARRWCGQPSLALPFPLAWRVYDALLHASVPLVSQ